MSGYLSDTSIFIGAEQRRAIGNPPDGQGRISIATLTELRVGVGMAPNDQIRGLRQATLDDATKFIALPYDDHVSRLLAELRVNARKVGRGLQMADAIIAATALVHDLTVWTLDQDFDVLAEVEPKLRVHGT